MPAPTIKNLNRDSTLFVKGGSMMPFLKTGDLLVMENVAPCSLKIGDIIVMRGLKDARCVIHRLMKIRQKDGNLRFLTKGDNNLDYDMEFTKDNFVAKGKYVMRGEKTVDLDSKIQRFFSLLFTVLSVLNLNISRLRSNSFTRSIKPSKTIASFLKIFLPKGTQISKYVNPSGKISFKAFAGRRFFGNADLEDLDNSARMTWTIKYPFYHTGHGEEFFDFLIRHARESGKESITFKNLPKESPLFDKLLKNYPGRLTFMEESRQVMIRIK